MKRKRYERPGPFGRGQPVKPPRRLLPGRALNPRIQRELRRANHMLSIGEHLRAAAVFAEIAAKAHDLGIVYPAPMLHLQAAQAYLLGEDLAASQQEARRGLELLAAQERWPALRAEGGRYLQALQEAAHQSEAADLQSWLDKQLEGHLAASLAILPENCPYCGANTSLEAIPVRRGQAAKCAYCASVVFLPDA